MQAELRNPLKAAAAAAGMKPRAETDWGASAGPSSRKLPASLPHPHTAMRTVDSFRTLARAGPARV
jgi:hypothetical protein